MNLFILNTLKIGSKCKVNNKFNVLNNKTNIYNAQIKDTIEKMINQNIITHNIIKCQLKPKNMFG